MPDLDEEVELPGYAPWELPTQRKYMPVSLQRLIQANTRIIRVDQNAYDKHTTGKHPESYAYLRELDEVLERWVWIRPAPSGGAKWEIYTARWHGEEPIETDWLDQEGRRVTTAPQASIGGLYKSVG